MFARRPRIAGISIADHLLTRGSMRQHPLHKIVRSRRRKEAGTLIECAASSCLVDFLMESKGVALEFALASHRSCLHSKVITLLGSARLLTSAATGRAAHHAVHPPSTARFCPVT